jgi:hypothetical protein
MLTLVDEYTRECLAIRMSGAERDPTSRLQGFWSADDWFIPPSFFH